MPLVRPNERVLCPPGSVLDQLVCAVERDPLPEDHTSSFWERYGRQTVVERENYVVLKGTGFSAHPRLGLIPKILCTLEQLSYSPVTRRWESFPEVFKQARRLARRLGVDMTRHEWSSAVVLSILLDHFEKAALAPKSFALIGDGDGFLGALILTFFPSSRIFSIELPKQLVFQAHTYQKAHPGIGLQAVLGEGANLNAPILLVHPDHIERLPGPIDCAASIVSMQEMRPASVQTYFQFLRRHSGPGSRFYCVNRVRNVLPDGEVSDFYQYPWRMEDEVFLHEQPAPYFRYFLDLSLYPNGPKLWGRRVPLVNYFNGESVHRIVRLAPPH